MFFLCSYIVLLTKIILANIINSDTFIKVFHKCSNDNFIIGFYKCGDGYCALFDTPVDNRYINTIIDCSKNLLRTVSHENQINGIYSVFSYFNCKKEIKESHDSRRMKINDNLNIVTKTNIRISETINTSSNYEYVFHELYNRLGTILMIPSFFTAVKIYENTEYPVGFGVPSISILPLLISKTFQFYSDYVHSNSGIHCFYNIVNDIKDIIEKRSSISIDISEVYNRATSITHEYKNTIQMHANLLSTAKIEKSYNITYKGKLSRAVRSDIKYVLLIYSHIKPFYAFNYGISVKNDTESNISEKSKICEGVRNDFIILDSFTKKKIIYEDLPIYIYFVQSTSSNLIEIQNPRDASSLSYLLFAKVPRYDIIGSVLVKHKSSINFTPNIFFRSEHY